MVDGRHKVPDLQPEIRSKELSQKSSRSFTVGTQGVCLQGNKRRGETVDMVMQYCTRHEGGGGGESSKKKPTGLAGKTVTDTCNGASKDGASGRKGPFLRLSETPRR